MHRLAETCERIAATTKKLEKTAIVAEYLKSCPAEEAAISAVFLSGRAFPAWEETTLQVGGRSLWQIVAELSGKTDEELEAAYRKRGDLGAVAGDVLPEGAKSDLRVAEVENAFRKIASARGSAAKSALVRELLTRVTPPEAKYIVKIMTGDLRIGLKESLVEEAIAKAYGHRLAEVQRANMLVGDIGQTTRLAAENKLGEAKMRLFHPLGFMLASPIDSPEEGLSYFADAAVEDKYDGIRAQAHVSAGEVRFFSRTRDEITESFPELPGALAGLAQDAILDGEIVAWEYPARSADANAIVDAAAKSPLLAKPARSGAPDRADEDAGDEDEQRADNLGRARPFTFLQQRLGRKKVSDEMLRKNPVAYLVFDVLYADGELVIDRPLRERAGILDKLLSAPRKSFQYREHRGTPGHRAQSRLIFDQNAEQNAEENAEENAEKDAEEDGEADWPSAESGLIIRAPVFRANSPAELDEMFVAARARGNEGLMIKDLNSPYTPGKRGKSWLKMKRELATLDVVVTAVEYGHGKRIGVLSDYTFAVWDRDSNSNGARLVNIGKAYSGLTDAEIAEMTKWFLEHKIPDPGGKDQGFRLAVEPKIVLEVAFNNMTRSDRHESGYALRFPRIARLRPDKLPEDADTIERVREIWESQK